MARVLTNSVIKALLQEFKSLPENWESRLRLLPKSNSRFTQRSCDIRGKNNSDFRIIIRCNTINPLDFSIILMFKDEDGTEFNLRRYNGKHPSQHTNKLEKMRGLPNSSFRNKFHIHMATQRYQEEELAIEGYAEVTDKYSSFETAMQVFVTENGFSTDGDVGPLFDSQGDSK